MKRHNNTEESVVPTHGKIHLSKRSQVPLNSIRSMYQKNIEMDLLLGKQGLDPLISLAIGAPHVPSNPLLDFVIQERTQKRLHLRQQIKEMELELQNGKNSKIEEELSTKKAKLVKMDTYQPSQGKSKNLEAAANLINHYYPFLNAEARHCCITNGASQGLSLLFQAFVEPGVSVGAFSPFFPPYKKMVESLGGTWVSIPSMDNCRPSVEHLTSTLSTHNISILVLNDPCNPTGIKMTPQELTELGRVLSKPENKEIIIISDETYHDLIFSENKDLFLHVVEKEEFKSRTCLILSGSKCLVGCPGLRLGLVYTPDMKIGGNLQKIGTILGVLMTDSTNAVNSIVTHIAKEIFNAKTGKSTPEKIKIHSQWEAEIHQIYSSVIKTGVSIFKEDTEFPLVVEPEGAFFGIISGKKLIGKKIPEKVKLLDGREVVDLPSKVETGVFATDKDICLFLMYAAEVVTVPASGFEYDSTKGVMRISLAVEEPLLREAARRLKYAASQVI